MNEQCSMSLVVVDRTEARCRRAEAGRWGRRRGGECMKWASGHISFRAAPGRERKGNGGVGALLSCRGVAPYEVLRCE